MNHLDCILFYFLNVAFLELECSFEHLFVFHRIQKINSGELVNDDHLNFRVN